MEKNILKWFKNNPLVTDGITFLNNILIAFSLIFWAFKKQIESTFKIEFLIEMDALFAFLSIIGVILNRITNGLLKESEYSPSYALATGYVKNFISPIITQLKETGNLQPKIYVFKPKNLEELSNDSIDRIKAEIKNRNYDLKTINLSLKNSRARDVLIINKMSKEQIYFDFPNTLLSLFAYVDYKLENNTNTETKKQDIVKELINKFYEKLDELILEQNLENNVFTCDNKLEIFD